MQSHTLHPCHFGFGWHCVCVYIVFVSLRHPSIKKHLMWSSFCSQWQIMSRSFVLFFWQVTYAWLVSTAQQVAQMEPTALQARTWTPQVHGRKATAWHARRANTVMAMATICPQGPVMLAITVLQEWMCHHLPSTHVLKVGGGDVLMLVWVLFVHIGSCGFVHFSYFLTCCFQFYYFLMFHLGHNYMVGPGIWYKKKSFVLQNFVIMRAIGVFCFHVTSVNTNRQWVLLSVKILKWIPRVWAACQWTKESSYLLWASQLKVFSLVENFIFFSGL